MKDPIVEEVRRYRLEHTREFQFDLHLICKDLRDYQQTIPATVIQTEPRVVSERMSEQTTG